MHIISTKAIVTGFMTAVIFLSFPYVYADKISDERMERQKKFLEMRERERKEKEQAKEREKYNKKVTMQNCDKAKSRLSKYKTAGGLYKYDKSGKKVFLDKAERKKAEQQAAADVKKWCK